MSENVPSDQLRQIMRQVPSPVTVVTAFDGEERRGITIGSFASTSLEPPIVSFNVARDAQMFPVITRAERFAVHILADDQAHLGNRFSIADVEAEEQFREIDFDVDADGTPILARVLAVIRCARREVYDAGDHVILLGDVISLQNEPGRRPLLYFDRNYHEIGPVADWTLFDPVQQAAGDED